MVRVYLFLSFLISLIFLSCEKNIGEEVLYSPDLKMPVVTGLYFTGEDSPEVLAVWRNPSGKSFCSAIGSSTHIQFGNPYETNVKVWVVPARLPEQSSQEVLKHFNGYFNNASGLSVAILMNESRSAGTHSIQYDFKDSKGNQLPEGFYRIYIDSGNWFRWCDVLNFRNESNYYRILVNQIRNQLKY